MTERQVTSESRTLNSCAYDGGSFRKGWSLVQETSRSLDKLPENTKQEVRTNIKQVLDSILEACNGLSGISDDPDQRKYFQIMLENATRGILASAREIYTPTTDSIKALQSGSEGDYRTDTQVLKDLPKRYFG